jgi:hypothetical protein
MSKGRTMVGALYFDGDDIIGHLSIGETHFQITGVKVSNIRSDIRARAIGKQADMFEQQQSEPASEAVGAEAASDKWRDLGPTKQSGMRCKQPAFWAYLSEEHAGAHIHDEEAAASLVRDICAVGTRADFAKPGFTEAREKWRELDEAYQTWLLRERM